MSAAPAEGAIGAHIERVLPHVVDSARPYASALLADAAGRRGGLSGRIRPMTPQARFVGPAFTVEVRPGDNLLIHAAMALVRPGDVLVIDGKGDLSCALMGGIMLSACARLGVAGVVVDGAVRDLAELASLGLPVFAAGANPNGPTKAGPGRINAPVSCGGVSVQPGDLIVADLDGVTAVDRRGAAEVIALAAKKAEEEQWIMEGIHAPAPGRYDWHPGWLDEALRSANLLNAGQSIASYRRD